MLVRMLVGLSGPAYSLAPGEEREFPLEEALRLIDANYAAPAADKKIERAVNALPAETRTFKNEKAQRKAAKVA